MRKLILILAIFGLVNNSCNTKKVKTEFSEFPTSKTLNGNRALINENFITAYLSQEDTLLIMHTPFHSENFIHIVNKNNFQSLYTLCKKGKGPNEIPNTNVCYYDKETGIYWVAVGAENSIYGYSLERLVKANLTYPIDTNKWPIKICFLTNLKKANRDGINLFSLSRNLNNKVLISFINKEGEIIDSISIMNKTQYFKKDNQEYKLYAKYIYDYHPSQQKIVIAHIYSDIVMGIDFDGNTIFETKGPDDINRNPEEPVLRRKTAYIRIKTDEKYIYCLYHGEKAFDGRIYKWPKKIHVFNWDGKPIEQIHLEYRTSDFVMDNENNRIITFSPEIKDIVYYDYSL